MGKKIKCELINDNFQNYKKYGIPKAQLVIADIPYNVGDKAYGSNPLWYNGWEVENGESRHAKKGFFNSDGYFKIPEYMHFCTKMLRPEPKEKLKAPAMIVFCAFDQMQTVIEYGKRYGFKNYYPLFFTKNYSPQVLKANMRIVGATEFAIVLYRDKLPKFNNNGKMVMNCFDWERDSETPKVHPTQKPVQLLKRLIQLFTDEGEVVIDPCCGSGSTLLAAAKMDRKAYGFEIDRKFFNDAKNKVIGSFEPDMFQMLKYEGKRPT